MSWTLRQRTGLTSGDIYQDWSGSLVGRHNLPDTLQVTGRTSHLSSLILAGSCTLEDDNGGRFSGPMTEATVSGNGTTTITFASDLIWLWARECWPTPGAAWASQTTDYDTRTGAAETVAIGFANANAGPGALTARRVAGLTMPTSLGRGGTVTVTARFDVLGQLVRDVMEAAGLRVSVMQSGSTLPMTITAPADLSATARYGSGDVGGPGLLSEDWSYTIRRPAGNVALVAGGGEGAARILRERSDSASVAQWGRIETFVDQRNTSDTGELDKAGDDELANGAQPVEIRATLPDVPGMRLVTDIPIGSKVGLDLGGFYVVDRLREVTTTISPEGDSSTGVVGSSDAGLTRDQKKFLDLLKSSKALRKVQAK